MDPLKNRNSLPVQIRVLVPISRSDRCRRLLQIIDRFFPEISTQLYLLVPTDQPDPREHLSIRQSLEPLINDHLSDFHCDLLIRTGHPVKSLLTTAIQHRCDLILLAHTADLTVELEHMKLHVPDILRQSLVPILLVPDPELSGTGHFPTNRILIHLNSQETSRLSTAFAMRTARLMGKEIILTTFGKSTGDSAEYLEFIRNRYLPVDQKESSQVACGTHSFSKNLRHLISLHQPDLLIISLQDCSFFDRYKIIDTLKNLLITHQIPVMLVNRHDWVKQQEIKMNRIYGRLTEFDLAHSSSSMKEPIKADDLADPHPELMMGSYSLQGLNQVFTHYGLFRSLEKLGYPDVHITFTVLDRGRERLLVFPDRNHRQEPLVDLVFKKELAPGFDRQHSDCPVISEPFLYIEWLCLQDPLRTYRNLEIPLPGQKYPGLGMGWKVMLIIKLLARRIGAAGVYNMPEYYHTARLYHRFFHYLNPALEGRLLAIDRDTFPLHVVDASWAALHGLIMQGDQSMRWIGGPQILPIHPKLTDYFQSEAYRDEVHKSMMAETFSLDKETLRAMIKNRSLYQEPSAH